MFGMQFFLSLHELQCLSSVNSKQSCIASSLHPAFHFSAGSFKLLYLVLFVSVWLLWVLRHLCSSLQDQLGGSPFGSVRAEAGPQHADAEAGPSSSSRLWSHDQQHCINCNTLWSHTFESPHGCSKSCLVCIWVPGS